MALKRQDILTLLVFGALLVPFAVYTYQNGRFHPLATFGTEYGNLAQNLALGHGFAGVFEVSQQASAWMPPLLPLFMAGVFLIFGIKTTASAQVLLVAQILTVWSALAVLLLVASRSSSRRWPLALPFAFYVALNPFVLFVDFHDMGLTLLLSALALYSLMVLGEGKLGLPMLCGAVLPLSSPSLALAYGLLVPFAGAGRRRVLAVWLCCLLSVFGWTARNAVTLGAFVPLKSNLWFDFHQANVLDVDGVVSDATFFRYHPAMGIDPRVRQSYRGGEMAFMAQRRRLSLEHLSSQPQSFMARLFHRFVNAAVWLSPEQETRPCAYLLPAETQAYLVQRHLMVGSRGGVVWCSLDLDEEVIARELEGLDPIRREQLLNDWRRARKELQDARLTPRPVLWGLTLALLPTLGLLLGLSRPCLRARREFRLAAGLYVLYLAPYVLVSHYARYQISALALASYLLWLSTLGESSLRGQSQILSKATDSGRSS